MRISATGYRNQCWQTNETHFGKQIKQILKDSQPLMSTISSSDIQGDSCTLHISIFLAGNCTKQKVPEFDAPADNPGTFKLVETIIGDGN